MPDARRAAPGAADAAPVAGVVAADDPLAPGPLLRIGDGRRLQVDIAPAAGGRIAAIERDGVSLLVGHDETDGAAIAWGCYPMVPWAGRVRDGRFRVHGRDIRLRPNLGAHAIHGTGFLVPWEVVAHDAHRVELRLALPEDARWPFGGRARQTIAVEDDGTLHLDLSVTAGAQAMPVTLGWHPWFRKPARIEFRPHAMYPRDADGIATLPLVAPVAGPHDDCFVNEAPVRMEIAGQRLQMTSDCTHWVLYDLPAHATCVEPQTGPPDAPNLAPAWLDPGATRAAWCRIEWP